MHPIRLTALPLSSSSGCLLRICTILLFVTNEQIVSAVDETPNVIRMSLKDSEFFVKDSYRFLSTNVNDRIGAIVNGMTDDLDNVDKLLGDAIQEELAESTRIESIFENILNISAGTSINYLFYRCYN